MADKKLESFKIGDNRKATVKSTSKIAKDEGQKPASQSVGFKRIETILESEEPQSVSAGLNAMLESLEKLEKSGSNKDKAAAKKAIVAIERTADLLNYLFATKEALQQTPKA